MSTVLQLAGAIAILVPFAWAQLGSLRVDSTAYLVPNLAGSLVLAAIAAQGSNWGFLLLETTWAAVSAWGLVRRRHRM
jgi:hypothetical protein